MVINNKTFCIYHQLHQPYRVNAVKNNNEASYEDFFEGPNPGKNGRDLQNQTIFEQVALSSYIQASEHWLGLLKQYPDLRITLSISGTLLQQALDYPQYGDAVIQGIDNLVKTGRVELLGETFYHSLAFLYDLGEYLEQIKMHNDLILKLFKYQPVSFRNTELIYHNHIAQIARELGYKTIVASKVYHKMDDVNVSGAQVAHFNLDRQELDLLKKYRFANPQESIAILLGETSVTNGLFAMQGVEEAKKVIFESDLNLINFFTDFEIYGEHNKDSENGVFAILDDLIAESFERGLDFKTVTQAGEMFNSQEYSSLEYTTWANTEHTLMSWVGNENQNRAHRQMAVMLTLIKDLDPNECDEYNKIVTMWRKLSTSDHFYYMPDMTGPDLVSLELFSPYNSAQEAYEVFRHSCEFLTLKIIQAQLSSSKAMLPIAHRAHTIYF